MVHKLLLTNFQLHRSILYNVGLIQMNILVCLPLTGARRRKPWTSLVTYRWFSSVYRVFGAKCPDFTVLVPCGARNVLNCSSKIPLDDGKTTHCGFAEKLSRNSKLTLRTLPKLVIKSNLLSL